MSGGGSGVGDGIDVGDDSGSGDMEGSIGSVGDEDQSIGGE